MTLPHFAYPFTLTASAGAAVVDQGSYAETVSQVQTVVACPLGACPGLPDFGIPDPTFMQAPPNVAAITAAVQRWVPQATEDAAVQALDTSGADWVIAVTPQITGTGQ